MAAQIQVVGRPEQNQVRLLITEQGKSPTTCDMEMSEAMQLMLAIGAKVEDGMTAGREAVGGMNPSWN